MRKSKKETYLDTLAELDNGDIRLTSVEEWPLEANKGRVDKNNAILGLVCVEEGPDLHSLSF